MKAWKHFDVSAINLRSFILLISLVLSARTTYTLIHLLYVSRRSIDKLIASLVENRG